LRNYCPFDAWIQVRLGFGGKAGKSLRARVIGLSASGQLERKK